MDTKTLLKARLSTVRRDLDRAIELLTEDLMPYAPTEGMRTCLGLLFEIAGKETELLTYAQSFGEKEWVEIEDFGGREKTLEGMKEVLAELRRTTLDYLDTLSEEDLEKPVKFNEPWWEGMLLQEVPLHEIFRTIAMHEWYHTGQLVSYLWARGLDPYDG